MKLSIYISELLYRYDCVIVPNFGGFLAKEISAQINHFTHTFTPPNKIVSFNIQLQNNDGLLANHISQIEGINYHQALEKIHHIVEIWKTKIEKREQINLNKIGLLYINSSGKLIFEYDSQVNYLSDSFGLKSFVSPAINRQEQIDKLEIQKIKSQVIRQKSKPIVTTLQKKPKQLQYIKYAVAAVVGFTLIGSIQRYLSKNVYVKTIDQIIAQNIPAQDHTLQRASFEITPSLPSITIEVNQASRELTKTYHVIAGAFRELQNAKKKVDELRDLKFNEASIIGINQWNLSQVAFSSHVEKDEAIKMLSTIRGKGYSDAWLLVKLE